MSHEKSSKQVSARDSLLESAKLLFSERGYHAVSTRELAEHAQVNLGAIPYHFISKAKLFIETVRSLMEERHARIQLFATDRHPTNRHEAAVELCRFIAEMLKDLCNENGPDACRIMFREISSEGKEDPEMYEALLSSVVEEFIKPIDSRLLALVSVLCPEKSYEERCLVVQCVIGQCAFYMTHRPFLKKLREEEYSNMKRIEEIAQFIASHNLRALGVSEKEIQSSLLQAR